MSAPSTDRIFPSSRSSIATRDTVDGVVVTMTTAPRRVARPDGFSRTACVTEWTRGPMHPDDAAVLVRIATEHGTDPAKWTPVLRDEPQGPDDRSDPTVRAGSYTGQGDFGDLL
jgi:hypothetical protein